MLDCHLTRHESTQMSDKADLVSKGVCKTLVDCEASVGTSYKGGQNG